MASRLDLCIQPIRRGQMSARHIRQVYIVIKNAHAIRYFMLAAEPPLFPELANCHLRHIRHQIVRHPRQIFADQSTIMRAQRIEVLRRRNPQVGSGISKSRITSRKVRRLTRPLR